MYSLTETEEEIMSCVWFLHNENESISLKSVHQRLKDSFQKNWAPQTTSTYLARMVQKQYLELVKSGREKTYMVQIEREKYLRIVISAEAKRRGYHSPLEYVKAIETLLTQEDEREALQKNGSNIREGATRYG